MLCNIDNLHDHNNSYFIHINILQNIRGDLEAIERIAYEFCETQFNDGVIYVEARYCPHLFMPSVEGGSDFTPKTIVEAVNKGFARGEKDFGIIACSILC